MEEEEDEQENAIVSYSFIRDIVNRQVEAVKLYDKQLELAFQMNELVSGYFDTKKGMSISQSDYFSHKSEFKKETQKACWLKIFSKLNMEKYVTKKLKEELNVFVERQTKVPFTVRNVKRMIEIVVGTNEQRMNRALEEVFDKVTERYHENRFNHEGWKTNKHNVLGKKFILPYVFQLGYSGQVSTNYNGNEEIANDMMKAVCFIMGDNYTYSDSLSNFVCHRPKNKEEILQDSNWRRNTINNIEHNNKLLLARGEEPRDIEESIELHASIDASNKRVSHRFEFGVWYVWKYFRIKAFKKGTLHCEFLDEDVWWKFNSRIALIKGYNLADNPNRKKRA